MILTFLSNLLISGILIGIIEGGMNANAEQYTSDVFIESLADEEFIERTNMIVQTLSRLPSIEEFSPRYVAGGTVEANYQTRRNFNNLPNTVGTSIVGIDARREDAVTHLADYLVEGEYLESGESGYVLMGATLLEQYSAFSDQFEPLTNVHPGTRVKISINSGTQNSFDRTGVSDSGSSGERVEEFVVKGIIDTKVGEVSTRVFMNEPDFRRLTGRTNQYASEIAVMRATDVTDEIVQEQLVRNRLDAYAKIQTAEEAIPQFLDDIKQTFTTLGFLVGLIVSAVGAITIFIVIYINALVRRKQIGILKAVGITKKAIIISYIIQAFFYAGLGVCIALVCFYGFFVPLVDRYPIDFPFSDGIIASDLGLITPRLIIVIVATFFAGLVPSWLITRQNTLNSILGR